MSDGEEMLSLGAGDEESFGETRGPFCPENVALEEKKLTEKNIFLIMIETVSTYMRSKEGEVIQKSILALFWINSRSCDLRNHNFGLTGLKVIVGTDCSSSSPRIFVREMILVLCFIERNDHPAASSNGIFKAVWIRS